MRGKPLPQTFYFQGGVAAQGLQWMRRVSKSLGPPGCLWPSIIGSASSLDWALSACHHPSKGQRLAHAASPGPEERGFQAWEKREPVSHG